MGVASTGATSWVTAGAVWATLTEALSWTLRTGVQFSPRLEVLSRPKSDTRDTPAMALNCISPRKPSEPSRAEAIGTVALTLAPRMVRPTASVASDRLVRASLSIRV
ncbi:hypothetical protein SPZE110945_19425 [Sphingomonas zeae]